MQDYYDTQINNEEENEKWQSQMTQSTISDFDTFVQNAYDWAAWPE